MSFYGTSFYEFKQFFKRFIFENKDGTSYTFDPQDLFDHLKQKGDHWIKFSKSKETLADGSEDDILLISHNLPDANNATHSGLNFAGDYDIFDVNTGHADLIAQYINPQKQNDGELARQKEIEELLNSIFYTCNITDINTVNQYLNYLGIKAEEISQGIEINTSTDPITGDHITTTKRWLTPLGPFENTRHDLVDEIHIGDIEVLKPGTVASIPEFDLDTTGHIVLKGNKYFTFPDSVIGFIGPDGEIIKVSASDNSDGSYIYFTGNGYIDFSFDEKTGALSINHKEGNDADVQRASATPNTFENIEAVVEYLNLLQDLEDSLLGVEPRPDITKEETEKKIQSFRSGNVLQIPNFKYDRYGHMVQDDEEPYNYYSLDMADAYTVKNFTTVFDAIITEDELKEGKSGWVLVQNYENLYYKEVDYLSNLIYSNETIFNTACDNVTRLILVDKGIEEFWVDNEQGKAIMYVRGDLESILDPKEEYAFQSQIVNSYKASSLPLGINGTVIVFLNEKVAVSQNEATGICTHTCQEIVDYLSAGKTVLCLDKTTHEYYVPLQEIKNENGDTIQFVFAKTSNDGKNNIVSTKVIIDGNQAYIKTLDFDFDETIEKIVKEKALVFHFNQADTTTLKKIQDIVETGGNVYYVNNEDVNVPLSSLNKTQAIFSYNAIKNGKLTIYTYIVDNSGKIAVGEYLVDASSMLPAGGEKGQILMLDDNGIPQWTHFLKVDTTDDNLIKYYNKNSEESDKWEVVSASWA